MCMTHCGIEPASPVSRYRLMLTMVCALSPSEMETMARAISCSLISCYQRVGVGDSCGFGRVRVSIDLYPHTHNAYRAPCSTRPLPVDSDSPAPSVTDIQIEGAVVVVAVCIGVVALTPKILDNFTK